MGEADLYWVALCRLLMQVTGASRERVVEMQTLLWVNSKTGGFSSDHQTRILRRLFEDGGVDGLGLADWRQVATTIVHTHIMTEEEEARMGRPANLAIDLQAGHSSVTANLVYGGTSGHNLDRVTEIKFMQASRRWQEFWKVSERKSGRKRETLMCVCLCRLTRRWKYCWRGS